MAGNATGKPLTLRGLFPATVTPFTDDLSVDNDALKVHLGRTAEAKGVQGLVVNAGLGELLQLSGEEQIHVIECALEVRRPGQLVIAGIEGRSPAEAVAAGLAAKEAGADALLVLPPFDTRAYRRFARNPASVHRFFEILDREIGHPMIVFQYPDASSVAYSLDALVAIADLRNVVGVKAATGSVTRYVELWKALRDRLSVLVASDAPPLLGMLLSGAHGALIGISVIGPERWAQLVSAALDGDESTATQIFNTFCLPLMEAVFENQEPVRPTSDAAGVKEALAQLGQIPSSRVRPLAEDVTQEGRREIHDALIVSGLLQAVEV